MENNNKLETPINLVPPPPMHNTDTEAARQRLKAAKAAVKKKIERNAEIEDREGHPLADGEEKDGA